MKIYDFIIIGAGIAGCSVAYNLQKNGRKIAIIDKEGVCSGGSGAAGAFLSPLPGKENSYNSFINKALEFSLDFYEKITPHAINKKGVLRVSNDNFNHEKLKSNSIKNSFLSNEKLQDISQNFTQMDGYFYENAAILNPQEATKELIKECDFYKKDVLEIVFKDGFYIFENIAAKSVVLAQGVLKPLIKIEYVEISPIFGVKIDVKTTTKVPFNMHKSISISTNKNDNTLSIGATKTRHDMSKMECTTTCEKCPFNLESDEAQVNMLLKEADELIKLEDLEVVKIYKGARATIKSYFPAIGEIINHEESLKRHPSIKNGTKIPPKMLEYHADMYIINALGSRGFVVAPYLAKILSEKILNNIPIPKELSCEKLFYKFARKSNSLN